VDEIAINQRGVDGALSGKFVVLGRCEVIRVKVGGVVVHEASPLLPLLHLNSPGMGHKREKGEGESD
ncbi:MAG: hypothetical protein ACYTXY_41470, partial [Nostoc sp.]